MNLGGTYNNYSYNKQPRHPKNTWVEEDGDDDPGKVTNVGQHSQGNR